MKIKASDIQNQLNAFADSQKKESLPYFFKTGKGEYGENDRFIGIGVPETRKIAKLNQTLPVSEIEILLQSEYHECRMCALMILIEKYKKGNYVNKTKLVDFYLSHTYYINNWDLVDLSCKDILGHFLRDKIDRSILYKLAESELLWDQRISIVSTFPLIKNNDFRDTLNISEIFLKNKHDLIHKASGWMLREIGKMNKIVLIDFLDEFYTVMPRTMLRYSIEKFSVVERKYYLQRVK